MKSRLVAVVAINALVMTLLAGCSSEPEISEGDTEAIPAHVQEVIDSFSAGGYECANPSVYLQNGNSQLDTTYKPDGLTCNESDSNPLGDQFRVFKDELEARSYYEQSCLDRRGGWYEAAFMLSPTVEMDAYERTIDQGNILASALGQVEAKVLDFSCDYAKITW